MANGSVQRFDVWVPIVTSDTVPINPVPMSGGLFKSTDAIWVGGAGIVVAVMQNGSLASFTCTAGTLLPIAAIRVNVASTATLMVALFQE